jgi:hypothetical protein
MATVTVTPGYVWTSGEVVTPAKMNSAATPSASATLTDGEVTNAKVATGIDAGKLTTGTLPADRIGAAAINASRLASDAVETAKILNAAVTPAKLSGAQSGSAPIYGVRAWVNFDGAFTNRTSNAYSRSGTTVTVTRTAHGLATGNKLVISSATDSGLDTAANTASQEITVVDANTFTFTTAATGATTGTLAFRRGIRSAGNVESVERNGTGHYTVTFATAMPDENYAVSALTYNITPAGSNNNRVVGIRDGSAKTTTQVVLQITSSTGTCTDQDDVSLMVVR